MTILIYKLYFVKLTVKRAVIEIFEKLIRGILKNWWTKFF